MAKITSQEATASKWQISPALASEFINKVGEQVALCIVNILMFIFMRNPVMAALWAVTFPRAYALWFANDKATRSISGWVIKGLYWKARRRFVRAIPEYFPVEDQLRAWREGPDKVSITKEAAEKLVRRAEEEDITLLAENKNYDLIKRIIESRTIGEEKLRLLLARAQDDKEVGPLFVIAVINYGISQKLMKEVLDNRSLDEGIKKSVKYASSIRNQRLTITNGRGDTSLIPNMAKSILPDAQSAMILQQYEQFHKAGCNLDRIAILELFRGGASQYTARIFKNEPKEIFDDPEIRAVIENNHALIAQFYA